MINRDEVLKLAQDYAIAEVRKNAELNVIRIVDDSEIESVEFNLAGEAPTDCWYVFCEDDVTGLLVDPGFCGDLDMQRLICISKTSGDIILDEVISTD